MAAITPPGVSTPYVHYLPTHTEQEMVNTIQRLLHTDFSPIRNAMGVLIPQDNVAQALNLFKQIQDRSLKIEAFASVLYSKGFPNPKEFYNALPVELQNEFNHQLWIANGRSDNGMGVNFGDRFVESSPLCGDGLPMRAVQAMRSNLS